MATLSNPRIEPPIRRFRVQHHHSAYCPDGLPGLRFEAETRTDTVLASTPQGALFIAQYHRFKHGSQFKLLGEGNE